MRQERLLNDLSYLKQMIGYAREVENTLAKVKRYGIDIQDEMVVASLAMHIGQIGEQLDSRKLSNELQEEYSDLIPWSAVKRFRDKAYHHYGGTDSYMIIKIATKEIPQIIGSLEFIIRDLEKRLNK